MRDGMVPRLAVAPRSERVRLEPNAVVDLLP